MEVKPNTGVFPDNMKVANILPILKPGKESFKKESYRPISNLHCLEKIFEEHTKIHMNTYFEENNLILKNHHGGLKGRSTMRARAIIEHNIEDGYQKKKLMVAASTDLSAAYDIVNHEIPLKKLEYYGMKARNKIYLDPNSTTENSTLI